MPTRRKKGMAQMPAQNNTNCFYYELLRNGHFNTQFATKKPAPIVHNFIGLLVSINYGPPKDSDL
jgi:hypothetical protein